MLYLAEVHQTSRLFREARSELKLLAKQQSESSWVAVSGEDLIPTSGDQDLKDGTLVLIDLSSDRQIQSIQQANRQLVRILQHFSRLREKAQAQIAEVDSWKESLRIQSQELSRREIELATYQEEVQQLEAAIADLQTRQQTLETQQETFQGSEHLQPLLAIIEQRQAELAQHNQALAAQRQDAHQHQQDLEQQTQALRQEWQVWQQAQQSLMEKQLALKLQEQRLQSTAEQIEWLRSQQQSQTDLSNQLAQLAQIQSPHFLDLEIQGLLDLPLEELAAMTQQLQANLDPLFRFVEDQEEELALQQQTLEALQSQETPSLETLALEQQRHQMLEETLVGQRRSLRDRVLKLQKYQAILQYRQQDDQPGSLVEGLQPILASLQAWQQQQTQRQQQLEAEVRQLQEQIDQQIAAIVEAERLQSSRQSDLQQQEQDLQQQQHLIEQGAIIEAQAERLQLLQNTFEDLTQTLREIKT